MKAGNVAQTQVNSRSPSSKQQAAVQVLLQTKGDAHVSDTQTSKSLADAIAEKGRDDVAKLLLPQKSVSEDHYELIKKLFYEVQIPAQKIKRPQGDSKRTAGGGGGKDSNQPASDVNNLYLCTRLREQATPERMTMYIEEAITTKEDLTFIEFLISGQNANLNQGSLQRGTKPPLQLAVELALSKEQKTSEYGAQLVDALLAVKDETGQRKADPNFNCSGSRTVVTPFLTAIRQLKHEIAGTGREQGKVVLLVECLLAASHNLRAGAGQHAWNEFVGFWLAKPYELEQDKLHETEHQYLWTPADEVLLNFIEARDEEGGAKVDVTIEIEKKSYGRIFRTPLFQYVIKCELPQEVKKQLVKAIVNACDDLSNTWQWALQQWTHKIWSQKLSDEWLQMLLEARDVHGKPRVDLATLNNDRVRLFLEIKEPHQQPQPQIDLKLNVVDEFSLLIRVLANSHNRGGVNLKLAHTLVLAWHAAGLDLDVWSDDGRPAWVMALEYLDHAKEGEEVGAEALVDLLRPQVRNAFAVLC